MYHTSICNYSLHCLFSFPVWCNSDFQFYCWKTDECRLSNVRCDGINQCPQKEDELNCPSMLHYSTLGWDYTWNAKLEFLQALESCTRFSVKRKPACVSLVGMIMPLKNIGA